MASGEVVGQILRCMPTAAATSPAVWTRGLHQQIATGEWGFHHNTVQYLDFLAYLHGYDGGGLYVRIIFTCPHFPATDEVTWACRMRRIADDAEDMDTSHTYTSGGGTAVTVPDVQGEVKHATITLSDGSTIDNWSDQELAVVRVYRNATDLGDDHDDPAHLLGVLIEEQ